MAECNSTTILNTMFYEADVAYIGSKSKEPGHQGYGTQQQPFFIALSTLQDNKCPQSIKLKVIPKDDSFTTKEFLSKVLVLSKDKVLNTDGKSTFNIMKDKIHVINERIDYSECNHRLYWLNIIVRNIKNTIAGIYHGVRKIDLPLFFAEQKYISLSHTITRKQISFALDTAFPMFSNE